MSEQCKKRSNLYYAILIIIIVLFYSIIFCIMEKYGCTYIEFKFRNDRILFIYSKYFVKEYKNTWERLVKRNDFNKYTQQVIFTYYN